MMTRSNDVIIGCGLAGATTAWILARQGYDAEILEKSPNPYGANGSFRDEQGNLFDFGRHILDGNRSNFTANFFRSIQKNKVRKFAIRRGIVVAGHLIPYAVPLEDWPEELAEKINLNPDAKPVHMGEPRECFAEAFGNWFANLVFDDMIEAIPVLQWLKDNGKQEEQLLRWIYPWFFPLTELEAPPAPEKERGVWHPESRDYHYRVRHANQPEEAMYPTENGYANWIKSLLEQTTDTIPLHKGLDSIDFDFDPETLRLKQVKTNGKSYQPDRVFWCAPAGVLAQNLSWELPPGQPQEGILGSFAFDKPITTDYHEILFADPQYRIKRISVREYFEGNEQSNTLQVEFLAPTGQYTQTEEEWIDHWVNSMKKLGIIGPEHQVETVQFNKVPRGMIPTQEIKHFVEECRERIQSSPTTNLVLPDLEAGPGNTSRSIPNIFRNVYRSLLND